MENERLRQGMRIRNHMPTDFKRLQKAYERLRKKMVKGCKVTRFYDDAVITSDSIAPINYTLAQWTDILRKMGFKIPKPKTDFRFRIINHYIQTKAQQDYESRSSDNQLR